MPIAHLNIGSNQGDRQGNISLAVSLIDKQAGRVLAVSDPVESAPWGYDSANPFINVGINIDTTLSPFDLLDALQAIERELGRDRAAEALEKARTGAPYVSRPIDIDIIFYDDEVIDTERLRVPHPRLAEREFALVPLCEIVRSRRHPVSGLTVGEMLDALRAQTNPGSCEK